MRYTYTYFRENMPLWKQKKDPIISRIIYRPLSFFTAAICANMGITANTVSYASAIVAVMAGICFLFDRFVMKILGAMLINLWLLMDCTDGNLARSVKKQPFGEFADSISSYILVAFMCTAMGYSVYQTGGLIVAEGSAWIILVGAFASTSDTLMRLIYQKYKVTATELAKSGMIPEEHDKRTDHAEVGSLRVRIESELGVGGILPAAILLAVAFNALDIVLFYCAAYYGGSCILMVLLYIRKAIIHTKNFEKRSNTR